MTLQSETVLLIIALVAQIIVISAGWMTLRDRITRVETHLVHIMRKLGMHRDGATVTENDAP